MKLTIILGAFLCLSLSIPIKAQYVITPVAPPPSFTFNDLWHFTVVRSMADDNKSFYITLRIYDAKNNLKVKSNTAELTLPVGSHYFNITNLNSLQPFTTSYYDAALLQQAISTGGLFPPGTYNLVYTLYGKAADGEFAPLTENNTELIVENMWPPFLLTPYDESILEDIYPTLTWSPAFSSSYNGVITYDLLITEIFSGQSKEQAIQANPSFFSTRNLTNTFYPYGSKENKLETDKKYAWQVTAHIGDIDAKTQVWEFAFGMAKRGVEEVEYLYTPVLEKLDGSFALAADYLLKIKYTEEYELPANSILLYNIYSSNGTKVRSSVPPLSSTAPNIVKGDNYLLIDVGPSGLDLDYRGWYILEVLNHKNEKWYLRFLIIDYL